MANSKQSKQREQAGAVLDGLFSGAQESAKEAPKKSRQIKTQPKDHNGSEKPQKAQKKVFSFRAEVESADSWRLWADAKGLKVDELGTLAITEYIKKHPLSPDQKQIYDLKMAQKKS